VGRIWLVWLGLSGCQQWFGLDAPVLAVDAAPTPDSNQVCIGSGLVSYCVPVAGVPTNAFDIPPGASLTIDPTMASLCLRTQLAGVEACVVPAFSASIAGTLRATGPYPIVIAVFDQITVNGTIDVSSISGASSGTFGASAGAGSDPASCPVLDGGGGILLQAGGGGGGGSFAIAGGKGGNAQSATSGGAAGPVVDVKALRGGCPGGKGGSGGDGPVGTSGLGGGAIYIVAATSITVNGTINANGGGGGGGGKRAGGGAGGSGGFIALDAPTVTLDATAAVFANGGGGGEGGDSNKIGDGGSVSAGPLDRALGGMGGSDKGGAGGDGSLDTSTGLAGMASMDATSGGGGGGGGGGGLITFYASVLSNQAVISPPPR
jgi:hypothetical protein